MNHAFEKCKADTFQENLKKRGPIQCFQEEKIPMQGTQNKLSEFGSSNNEFDSVINLRKPQTNTGSPRNASELGDKLPKNFNSLRTSCKNDLNSKTLKSVLEQIIPSKDDHSFNIVGKSSIGSI